MLRAVQQSYVRVLHSKQHILDHIVPHVLVVSLLCFLVILFLHIEFQGGNLMTQNIELIINVDAVIVGATWRRRTGMCILLRDGVWCVCVVEVNGDSEGMDELWVRVGSKSLSLSGASSYQYPHPTMQQQLERQQHIEHQYSQEHLWGTTSFPYLVHQYMLDLATQ